MESIGHFKNEVFFTLQGVIMTIEIYKTPEETAIQLRISAKSLANSRSKGGGIDLPFIRLNTGAIRYRQSDIDAYMKAHFIDSKKENDDGEK